MNKKQSQFDELSYVLVCQGYAVACPKDVQNFMQAQRFQMTLACDEGVEWLTCTAESFREIESTLRAIECNHDYADPTEIWVGVCCGASWVQFGGVFECDQAIDAYESAVTEFALRGLEPLWVLRLSDAQQTFCESTLAESLQIAR